MVPEVACQVRATSAQLLWPLDADLLSVRLLPAVSHATLLSAALHRQGPPSPSSQNVSSWHGTDFKEKCNGILRQVTTGLGADHQWFAVPVNSAAVPDYYSIITQPMDLGKVQKRLSSDRYNSPKEFCEVRLEMGFAADATDASAVLK